MATQGQLTIPATALVTARDPTMEQCIVACRNAEQVCLESLSACLRREDITPASTLVALRACAEMARVAGDVLIAQSRLHTITCDAMAQMASACADECNRRGGDAVLSECVPELRECAEACRRMSEH